MFISYKKRRPTTKLLVRMYLSFGSGIEKIENGIYGNNSLL